MRPSRLAACFSLFAAVACGGATPDPSVAEAESPAASSPSSSASAAPAEPSPPTVSAAVLAAAVSSKADNFTRATIAFKNTGPKPCRLKKYTLTWAGGKKTVLVDNFVLAPAAEETRAIKVHAADGDVSKLTGAAGTSVDVSVECGPWKSAGVLRF